MGLFDSIKLAFRGNKNKKEEIENEKNMVATTLDNLKVGGSITFPLLFQPETLEPFSEKIMAITDQNKIDFNSRKSDSWAVLNSGQLFVKKNQIDLEIIKAVRNTEDFVDKFDFDLLDAVITLDDDEVIYTDDSESEEMIVSNDKALILNEDTQLLKKGDYLVQRDELFAKSSLFNKGEFRYIEAKSTSGLNYVYIFIFEDGETLFFESLLMESFGFDFI